MALNTIEIISKKRDGRELTESEIDYLIQGFTQGHIPEYQMSAFLMAVYWQGMTPKETAVLTYSMLHSGATLNLSDLSGPVVDKHSTGGVGDKISLILAPLLAAAGYKVPMMSGRGLLHSGGTLDKLEAIPGFRTDIPGSKVFRQLQSIGFVMIGQTKQIAPADRKMYALRDATATVASIPLITSSILSKKLSEDIDALILDVKFGRGAFFEQEEDALRLARSLIQTAELNGLKTVALITDMNQPLGMAIGNWLEVKESIQCLTGHGSDDLMELTFALAGQLIRVVDGEKASHANIRHDLKQLIANGAAFQKFRSMVKAQGGDVSFIDNPEKYRRSKFSAGIFASKTGYIQAIDALAFGLAVVQLGGGRKVIEDSIDYCAGIWLDHKVGEFVNSGDRLAMIYTDKDNLLDEVKDNLEKAIRIGEKAPPDLSLIRKVVDQSGERPWHL